MSMLYLVRHGQASQFAENYDVLSPLGIAQGQQLGDYWVEQGVEIDEVFTGTLARQIETAAAVGERLQAAGRPWPVAESRGGLDEYQADAILSVLGPKLRGQHDRLQELHDDFQRASEYADRYRTFYRLLEATVRHWIEGDVTSDEVEPWPRFRDRVLATLAEVRSRAGRGRRVAVFTSGGPIGVVVKHVLDAPDQKAVDLHLRIHNASVTKFTFTTGRISLDQFNAVEHLPRAELRTYR